MKSDLKIGCLLKLPKGKVIYKLTRFANHRFGDIEVMNVDTQKKYIKRSDQNWVVVIRLAPEKKIKSYEFN